jgi:hypothetical protein
MMHDQKNIQLLFNYVSDRVNQKSPRTNRRPSVHSECPSTSILMCFSLLLKLQLSVMVTGCDRHVSTHLVSKEH